MADRGVRRVERPRGAIGIPVVALVLALVLSFVLWSRGNLNSLICDGDCGPANVTAPEGLTDDSSASTARTDPAPSGSLDASKVEAAVSGAMKSAALGDHVGLVVMGSTGEVLVSRGTGTFIPASTAKLLTGFAALSEVGPQTRFTTSVVSDGDKIVLVGGGDPYLRVRKAKGSEREANANLTTLAARTAKALKRQGVDRVSLGFDSSLFSGPAASPGWKSSYVSGNIVTPVSALWADQGVVGGIRSRNPAASAATIFAKLLESRGIAVAGTPDSVSSSSASTPLASVRSATVAQIVEALVRTSDNQAAEVMLRHVAIAADEPATFEGGADAVTGVLAKAGIDTTGLRLFDGSGLSRNDRVSPTTLAQTVLAANANLSTSTLLSSLPVSGFDGTLTDRFSKSKRAYGLVRAKTGTLTGVHSLAGYAVEATGLPVIFALMSDGTPKIDLASAEAALDRVAAAIAACSCGSTP
ncbi:D-alanyl-D-alanine carboxypeptidase/D-alanyl-D-alanine-endopeptidase (penicillin-binding protein 4) [Aeromicrobium panaciterrae]|uniref:D-alanyl-D-alanine carboxypeptidase/D-alanyl-D-alanine-endopeptidase (Penicillin-binding protein 4) n=1 Tax=Aeromicrobium panaciterrae TaxID=363861 RepID=A0ABU1URZ2_9ACTN|nr:D-alanyl-D-alanine carboxypeptidase/D-alanyl-D-alanine-endopeptidase [Aeromicrobium panaciterrae]MDR7087949.1 D-alanyl-D-alanine carboxypeptidase/D-alanyl-D-alanine-endopeptidase (penicillin-binding protein 4) [Aeromicrobium panaciterrae]